MCGGGAYYGGPGIILLLPLIVVAEGARSTNRVITRATDRVKTAMAPTNLWTVAHPKEIDKKLLELNVKLTLSKDATLYCQRGLLLMMLRRYNEAERDLQDALRIQPKSFLAHYYLSTLYETTGRPESIEMHTKAIELYTEKSAQNDDWMSHVTEFSDHVEESLHNLKQALPDVFGLRGLRDQHRKEAVAVKQALRQVVSKPDLYSNRGLCYYRRAEYFDALRDFEQAVKIAGTKHNNLPLYFHNMGLVYFVLHDLERALECFTKAIGDASLGPVLANAYAMRHYTYMRLGDEKKAYRDRNQALRVDPRAPVSQFQYRLLPDPLLINIFSFLACTDLINLSLTSHAMKSLCYTPYLWPLKYNNMNYHLANNTDPRVQDLPKEKAIFRIAHDFQYEIGFEQFDYTYSQLKYLCLYWSVAEDRFLKDLQQLLSKTVNLEKLVLFLFHCSATEIDWSACTKSIKHLTLQHNNTSTIEDWIPLLQIVGPNLESLDLSFFPDLQISENTYDVILTYCKKLKKLVIAKYRLDSTIANQYPRLKITEGQDQYYMRIEY